MPNELEIGKVLSDIQGAMSPMFYVMATLAIIPVVIALMRAIWHLVKWALRWLLYVLKDERKKKKEEYTAHYDALLGKEPTRWQHFTDWLLPLLESLIDDDHQVKPSPIDYNTLPPWERENIKQEMYRGVRPWDVALMGWEESEWLAYKEIRATQQLLRHDESEWHVFQQTQKEQASDA